MLLRELHNMNGTYAAVNFSEQTIKDIKDFISTSKIPNPIRTSKIHTTLIYSRKHLPEFKAVGKYEIPFLGTPTELHVWESRPDDGTEPTKCLVLGYECSDLSDRHNEIMDEHKGTYDFDQYNPHITLSYNIGDFDVKSLKVPDFDIEIVSEYHEDLDLNWAKTKGTS